MASQDAQRSKEIKQRAVEKHSNVFSFRPDIGVAAHRRVEADREQFVQRLYDHRLARQEAVKKLHDELRGQDARQHKVLLPEDVALFVARCVVV